MRISKTYISPIASDLISDNYNAKIAYLEIETSIKQNISSGSDHFIINCSKKNCNGVVPVKEGIYKHCIKTIEKSLDFGGHGLPKIGSGDWNDGLSEVGSKGKGESVWLGFFLYNILDRFDIICEKCGKTDYIEKYEGIKNELKKALNNNAWDGRWYKRAFADSGDVIGSCTNEECKIDSIAQSWAVISNAGDNDKKYIAMESVEKYLINKDARSY